jgi:predicted GNAT superfamily acetyltransferase
MASTSAWELAHEAARTAGVELRPLDSLEDADEILRVMIATWGEHQLVPREMLRALAHSGNVPYGAVREGQVIGYVLGWVGVDRDGLHMHSHMLAVLPDRRHGGVGYALKLAQRAQALEQGIHVVRWTFDPMVARNAWFNLGKLGAVADRFSRDFYGEMGDLLNRGERSDRFVARWDLDREPGPRSVDPVAVVEIPQDHARLRERDPSEAGRRRDEVAEAVAGELDRGRVAVAFDRGRSAYLFVPAEDVSVGGDGR